MKRLLIHLIKFLHLAILLFVVFGWLSANQFFLMLHIAFVPLMVLQWQFNQGTCFLTNLEHWLIGDMRHRGEQQGRFIKGIINRFIDPLPSDKAIKTALYLILVLAMSASVTRLLNAQSMP